MKIKSKLILLSLVLVIALSFSACSEEPDNTIVGTFSIVSVSSGENELNVEEIKQWLGDNFAEENFIEFRSDGTFSLVSSGLTEEGTYTLSGEVVSLTHAGNEANEPTEESEETNIKKGTLVKDKFTLEVDEVKYVFQKNK